jgi:hypothetical protein
VPLDDADDEVPAVRSLAHEGIIRASLPGHVDIGGRQCVTGRPQHRLPVLRRKTDRVEDAGGHRLASGRLDWRCGLRERESRHQNQCRHVALERNRRTGG